jgi:hypothetical protein
MQPWEGAKKEGFKGFLKGAGKGTIGLVTKPGAGKYLCHFPSATLCQVRSDTYLDSTFWTGGIPGAWNRQVTYGEEGCGESHTRCERRAG